VLFRKIHQLRSAFPKNPPTAICSHCSWWVFGSSTLQLVDSSNQHFAVGGFSLGGIEKKNVIHVDLLSLFITTERCKYFFYELRILNAKKNDIPQEKGKETTGNLPKVCAS